MSDVVADDSPDWFPTLQAIQLANFCDAAAVALVCYDTVLMFPREVKYVWRKPWSTMSTLYVIARYLGIALAFNFWACVAVDRFENFGIFVYTIIAEAIMSLRIYAMYLRSKIILVILVASMLTENRRRLAVAVVIFGPQSGISGIVVNILLFLLAFGRFVKHALEMHRMLHRWKVNDLMRVLVRDSIVYFFLHMVATIILMISVWGAPENALFFAIGTAYTQNEASVLIPRLVISFRENYSQDEQHGVKTGQRAGGGSIRSEKMEFRRRATVTTTVMSAASRAEDGDLEMQRINGGTRQMICELEVPEGEEEMEGVKEEMR
ncbi:hypothetical protein F5I97DRAFT_1926653 [Phlebopus sp. FC_14]|nr:hypothetical protein F5I97DRAFT_1926653 [Phlebopus sp. FC_14]